MSLVGVIEIVTFQDVKCEIVHNEIQKYFQEFMISDLLITI